MSKPRVDEERTAFIRPFAEALATPESEKPFAESPQRRRKVVEQVLVEVKGFGEGTERGACEQAYVFAHTAHAPQRSRASSTS